MTEKLKRFVVTYQNYPKAGLTSFEREDGDWVRYEDAAKLEARVAELEADLKESERGGEGHFNQAVSNGARIQELEAQLKHSPDAFQTSMNHTAVDKAFDAGVAVMDKLHKASRKLERDELEARVRELELALSQVAGAYCPTWVAHPQSVWFKEHVQATALKALEAKP